MRGPRDRQREAQAPSRVQHDPQILHEDFDRAERRVVPIQHVWHPVGEHPGIPGAVGNDFIQRARIGAGAGSQRHRLGRGSDMHPGQKLVHHLDGRTDPGLVAKPVYLAGNRPQRRVRIVENVRCAGGHDRQIAAFGADSAAGDRCVQHAVPAVLQPPGQVLRVIGRHGCGQDDDCPGRKLRHGPAVAKEHGFGLVRRRHHDEQDIRALRRFRRGDRAIATQTLQGLDGLRADIVAGYRKASLDEIGRHSGAHCAQADKTSSLFCHLFVPCLLSATA